MGQTIYVGLARPGKAQADPCSGTSETDTPADVHRAQIATIGSWRAKWTASAERRRQRWLERQKQNEIEKRQKMQYVIRRKACLTRLYQARADLGMDNMRETGEPFMRYLARTYMSDLRLLAVRHHLRQQVMTPADYAEMMIWYRRAQKECGKSAAAQVKKQKK
ncbi:uncharacterized protein SPSK_09948 [Sporothrix schenckii 1099-18]|uniref:Uncharacterized protein n=2 Tax=Sporothrix schenckii TaxID=29908 RepID=U7Q5C9_SPOS1|nr:uncharacterized protein SPSK_09948 [Sporothrix schenckii 1099-18]ERT03043.1 hypothetical protein HMPREF1624_01348 [Sporothrix schenckii ATCC 58251]KJR84563.1 hypothetical protein SPSK_09948 [Sporothrix schenckii 1099-18]